MSPLNLPYPGFSWSMTQHVGPATQQRTIYELLLAAHAFSGDPDCGDRITEHLLRQGLLTANVRADAGRPQTWRDYQQVLAELGLVVSTRFTEGILITPVGLMLLDGIIGYSELITTQCLRYQYPNGHKQDISPIVRQRLEGAGRGIPPSRTELDAAYGVLVKPAVLALRVLLELLKGGESDPHLTGRECAAALLPIRQNTDWGLAVGELINVRRFGVPDADTRSLRHIQEWFRLLNLTDIFSLTSVGLTLTPVARQNAGVLEQLCQYHENPGAFWIQSSTDREGMGREWFDYYGNPEVRSQWLIPEQARDIEYLNSNYPGGLEEPEEWEESRQAVEWSPEISLQAFEGRVARGPSEPAAMDMARIARGHMRRQRSTRLHEQIVGLVARKLESEGYRIAEDPLSVDLIASRGGEEAIIEVKTVTPRTMSNRIRLGVGQLLEYRHRRQIQEGGRPGGILVLSSAFSFPEWFIGYFERDIMIGLVSRTSSDLFQAYTPGGIERLLSQ